MQHSFLNELKEGQFVDCVYYVSKKSKRVNKNGTKYVMLSVKDNSLGKDSLGNNIYATVYYYYNNEADLEFLLKEETKYLKIRGKCFKVSPEICLYSYSIMLADSKSGIVFNRANLFSYSKKYEEKLLSEDGMTINLRHTSCDEFQTKFTSLDKSKILIPIRNRNSEHDSFQVDVRVDGINELLSIPAYLTPTMGKLMDEGYDFQIYVDDVTEKKDDEANAGLKVTIIVKE